MFFGLYETKAEKEVKKLKAEIAAEAKREVTLQDVQTVVTKYGKKLLDQAEEVGSGLLTKASTKATEIEKKATETFNEKSGKIAVSAVEAAFKVSKKLTELKSRIVKK